MPNGTEMSSGTEQQPAEAPAVGLCSVSAASRRGPGHSQNEDRWAAVGADGVLLLAVADGMGGTSGGGAAAGVALHALLELTGTLPDLVPPAGIRPAGLKPFTGRPIAVAGDEPEPQPTVAATEPAPPTESALVAAVALAHERVRAAAAPGVPEAFRPGTTLTAALVLGDRLLVAHVGDSGCWLLHRGGLERLTEVHTHAAVLVAAGALDRGSPAALRLDNLLTRHLGMPGELRPQLCVGRLRPGDRLLLATDGLTRALPTSALAALLARPEVTAARLVGAAVAAGARDDVTALLATVGDPLSGYPASVGAAAAALGAESLPPVVGDGERADVTATAERQVGTRPAAGTAGSGRAAGR